MTGTAWKPSACHTKSALTASKVVCTTSPNTSLESSSALLFCSQRIALLSTAPVTGLTLNTSNHCKPAVKLLAIYIMSNVISTFTAAPFAFTGGATLNTVASFFTFFASACACKQLQEPSVRAALQSTRHTLLFPNRVLTLLGSMFFMSIVLP